MSKIVNDNSKNDENNEILGQNIRRIRKSLNMTQETFAEKLNINWQYLSRVENGKVGITIGTAINICKIANCSSALLFRDIIKSPYVPDNYELLSKRDQLIIDKMITYLMNTK